MLLSADQPLTPTSKSIAEIASLPSLPAETCAEAILFIHPTFHL